MKIITTNSAVIECQHGYDCPFFGYVAFHGPKVLSGRPPKSYEVFSSEDGKSSGRIDQSDVAFVIMSRSEFCQEGRVGEV